MSELIKRILSDPDFPKRHLETSCYEQNGKVYQDFVNSDGKPMRRCFRYAKFNCDGKFVKGELIRGDFDVLIWSAEFI